MGKGNGQGGIDFDNLCDIVISNIFYNLKNKK